MEDLSESIQKLLKEITEKDIISQELLDGRIIGCIKSLSENESLHILDNFLNNDLSSVENKEMYLYDSFQDHINSNKPAGEEVAREPSATEERGTIRYLQDNVKDAADKEKIMELLTRTGYNLIVSTSQRRYGGPPPDWTGPPPGCGEVRFCSQVHLGRLDKTVFEDILVPILSEYGRVYQLRIMTNPANGSNKGFAFCDFFTKEEAEKFIEAYNEKPLIPGSGPITATLSLPKCRLYVGGFSTQKSKEEVEREFKAAIPSLIQVTAFAYRENKKRNRGYAFLEFNSHNDASVVKKHISSGKIVIFNQVLTVVDWAEPLIEENEVGSDGTKKLFIRFGTLNMTEEKIKALFAEFGEIRNVRKLESYGFVTFETKEAAQAALTAMDKKEIEGVALEVSYSKHSTEDDESFSKKRRVKDTRARIRAMERAAKYRHRYDDYDMDSRRRRSSPRRIHPYYDDYASSYRRHDVYDEHRYRRPQYRSPSPRRYDAYHPPPPANRYSSGHHHDRYSPPSNNYPVYDDRRYPRHSNPEHRRHQSPIGYPHTTHNPIPPDNYSDYSLKPSFQPTVQPFDGREQPTDAVSVYRQPPQTYPYQTEQGFNVQPQPTLGNQQPALTRPPHPSMHPSQSFAPRPGTSNIRYW